MASAALRDVPHSWRQSSPKLPCPEFYQDLITWAWLIESLATWLNSLSILTTLSGGWVDITQLKALTC